MHVCHSVDEFLRYAGNDRTGLIVGGVLIIGGVDRSDWVRQGDAGGKRILVSVFCFRGYPMSASTVICRYNT